MLRGVSMKQLSLQNMLDELSPLLEAKQANITASVQEHFNGEQQFVVFLSASNGRERAHVVHEKATTFQTAWTKATEQLRKTLLINKIKPTYIKADMVTSIESIPYETLIERLNRLRKNYFRYGISFDRSFHHAFLEEEINANVFFHKWEEKNVQFAKQNVTNYLRQYKKRNVTFTLQHVHLFNTVSLFHDSHKIHDQYNNELFKGTRKLENLHVPETEEIIHNATGFLLSRTKEDGSFYYANFPAFNKEAKTYNMIHHAYTIYAMLVTYHYTNNKQLLEAIEKGLTYILDHAIISKRIKNRQCAFIVEKATDNEIKLGALAFTLLAFVHYELITGNKTYKKLTEQLAFGIQYFQQTDGSFVHVFNEDLTVKDEKRIISYDGQAVLALLSLYSLRENPFWLLVAEKSVTYFTQHNYARYGDPWLSAALFQLVHYRPKREYYELAILTANRHVNNAFVIETPAALLLQLLTTTYNTIETMKVNELFPHLLEKVHITKLKQAIYYRANYQLNSFMWPEMAIYFKNPAQIMHSFYTRHDSYRIRIDDLADHIIGLISYLQIVKQLDEKDNVDELQVQEQLIRLQAEHLTIAKRNETYDKWTDALAYLHPLFNNDDLLDITYATYAKYFRMNGQINVAQQILADAHVLYPKSESVLLELLRLYAHRNEWDAVRVIASDLVKIDATEAEYYLELGRASAEMKDYERAKASFKIRLIYTHNMPTEKIVVMIKKQIFQQPEDAQSTYSYLRGRNNLGLIRHIHQTTNEKYFTKIARNDLGTQREHMFYAEILQT